MTHQSCDCLEQFAAKLKEHNTEISVTFSIPRDGSAMKMLPRIATNKIEARKRVGPMLVVPTFCPFCGNRYEAEPAQPATPAEGGAA